jgi:hypothetical protein
MTFIIYDPASDQMFMNRQILFRKSTEAKEEELKKKTNPPNTLPGRKHFDAYRIDSKFKFNEDLEFMILEGTIDSETKNIIHHYFEVLKDI